MSAHNVHIGSVCQWAKRLWGILKSLALHLFHKHFIGGGEIWSTLGYSISPLTRSHQWHFLILKDRAVVSVYFIFIFCIFLYIVQFWNPLAIMWQLISFCGKWPVVIQKVDNAAKFFKKLIKAKMLSDDSWWILGFSQCVAPLFLFTYMQLQRSQTWLANTIRTTNRNNNILGAKSPAHRFCIHIHLHIEII